MNKKAKQRVAFWIGTALTACIALSSIWFASRIGFGQALKFSQYQETVSRRDLCRSIRDELSENRQALWEAVLDWNGDPMWNLHIVEACYRKAGDGEELFRLDSKSVAALRRFYESTLDETIAQMREGGVAGARARAFAPNLWYHLEQADLALGHLDKRLAELDAAVKSWGIREFRPVDEPEPPAADPELDPAEVAALALPAAAWVEGAPAEAYGGAVSDFGASGLGIPCVPRGPLLMSVFARLPEDRRIVRLWLCFTRAIPCERLLDANANDEELRKIFGLLPTTSEQVVGAPHLRPPGDAHVVSIPVERQPDRRFIAYVLDQGRPLGWHWVYALAEDDRGDRHAATEIQTYRIRSEDDNWLHARSLPPDVIVLPARAKG